MRGLQCDILELARVGVNARRSMISLRFRYPELSQAQIEAAIDVEVAAKRLKDFGYFREITVTGKRRLDALYKAIDACEDDEDDEGVIECDDDEDDESEDELSYGWHAWARDNGIIVD